MGRPGSGFTLPFESWCLELAKHMPVAAIAEMVGEHDTRLWRFIQHYVGAARSRENYENVESIGIYETCKKGHNYITVAADLNEREVIFVTDGRDLSAVTGFADDFVCQGGNKEKIKVITYDMPLGFRKGKAMMMREELQDIYESCPTVKLRRRSQKNSQAGSCIPESAR